MEDGDWEELDPEAQTFIMLCFEKDVTFLVNEEATTRGVWEKLKTNSNELDLFEIQNMETHPQKDNKLIWCTTYYHVKNNKLDERTNKAIFLRSMLALSKAMVPNNIGVRNSNTQVVEIESRDYPDYIHVRVENYGVTQNEDNEPDHEEIQNENAHVLQQQ
ncbi:hypothetical protein KIW84_065394 [Lathyrus oleraceus]|uniref:Uncharacterized protein n=1 Tax=Pisum sativum TaxID=3888 RepID=A0A9D5A9P8_PEA|nr:hypothetical protein KIW84_065394 [Pisum sativum]